MTSKETIEEIAPDFTYVDVERSFPKANLVYPTSSGYLLIAAELDRRPTVLRNSRAKRTVIRRVRELLVALRADDRVVRGFETPPLRYALAQWGLRVGRSSLGRPRRRHA